MDFSMDTLLPKYTVLCMFSHMSKYNFNELFNKLSDTPEFSQFLEHVEGNTAKQSCTEFMKNTIYATYDGQVKSVLEDEEINNILKDTSLTKEKQIKLFIARATINLMFDGEDVPPEVYQIPFVKIMIQQFDSMLTKIDGIHSVNSPTEFYHIIVSFSSKFR